MKLPPYWIMASGDWISTMALFGLFVAFGEMHLARERIEAQARAVMRAQGKVAREVLESRLAAMQAQVEPQFLFDSLVDVRALYERAPTVGAATLDRLITYLRVALPRLRETGSTVDAEVELVRAYLSVVAARHDGRPRLDVSVAPEAGAARFYPMLLLPLVQRAARESAARAPALPAHIALGVRRADSKVVAQLRFDAPGLCAEDSDLARVRQRLAGLYRGDAALECSEAGPGQTEFTLTVPYEHSHGDRR
jgi:LytS/YehU family sensor histidine kinase